VTETGFLRLPKSLYLMVLSKATDRLRKLTWLAVTAFRETPEQLSFNEVALLHDLLGVTEAGHSA